MVQLFIFQVIALVFLVGAPSVSGEPRNIQKPRALPMGHAGEDRAILDTSSPLSSGTGGPTVVTTTSTSGHSSTGESPSVQTITSSGGTGTYDVTTGDSSSSTTGHSSSTSTGSSTTGGSSSTSGSGHHHQGGQSNGSNAWAQAMQRFFQWLMGLMTLWG